MDWDDICFAIFSLLGLLFWVLVGFTVVHFILKFW